MTATDKKFYHLYWTDSTCRSIFSNHKSQLLENEVELIFSREKFYAQRLILTNSQKRKGLGKDLTAIKRRETQNIELIHDLEMAIKGFFNETRIEIFVKNRFGRTFKKIEEDFIREGNWLKLATMIISAFQDDEKLLKYLKEYYLIPEKIASKNELADYYGNELKTQFREFIKKENLSELAISIDLLSTYYNFKIHNNLLSASKHYTDILYVNENYKDRLAFFDSLYEIGIIKGGKLKSSYECVNCQPNVFNGIISTNLKPSHLNLKCPCCKKEMLYIVPYELDETIYKHIVSSDGLLFHAIQYLLEQNKYRYSANQIIPDDVEVDFCLFNEKNLILELIEVKMFMTDRPIDTQIGNIRASIGQFKTIIDKLSMKDSNFKNIKHSIVTNISDEMILRDAKRELEKDMIEYKIDIYSPIDFYSRISHS